MKAQIFMKFETYAHKIVIDHHKDPRKDARARVVNVNTMDKTIGTVIQFRATNIIVCRILFPLLLFESQKSNI